MTFDSAQTVASWDWQTANDAPARDPSKWTLEGSNDGAEWVTLRQHANDESLADQAMATAAWPLEPGTVQGRAFRHFRILQTGRNAAGNEHLCCAGIELYGVLQGK